MLRRTQDGPSQDDDPNLLRIMISTDNHLGVWERDEWRGSDSFLAFNEVLLRAKDSAVDMVLLGGDLFHENKPSRSTLVNTLHALRRHCLGDEPVAYEIVSDPALIQSGLDNTHDSNLNVGLPVFTIHGNHDDPSGTENLSAVDILSAVRYVNYFGKHAFSRGADGAQGRIRLSPLLFRKGETRVAIYGLGFMREERLARAFQEPGQVTWLRPEEESERWFNIFVLHQNRVQHFKTGPNNKARSIHDSFLPAWLDLVIWGHEHECKPHSEGAAAPDAGFVVLQPGSTVATSLSEPESKPKACFVLDIVEDKFRIEHVPLQSARPFKWKAVALAELGAEPGNHKQIESLLAGVVEELIAESLAEQRAAPADVVSQPLGPELGLPAGEPRLPLVRVRVDYTGFTTVHTQRFGQRFVNRVANPGEILLWAKSAERRAREARPRAAAHTQPLDLDQTQIEDLISDFAGQLEILPAPELGDALKRFVDKDEKSSLADTYNHALRATQDAALADLAVPDTVATGERGGGGEEGAGPAREEHEQARVVGSVSNAGRRLQAEAMARFAEGDARLRSATDTAQQGVAGVGGSDQHEDTVAHTTSAGEDDVDAVVGARGHGRRRGSTGGVSQASTAVKSSAGRKRRKGSSRGTKATGASLASYLAPSQAVQRDTEERRGHGKGTQAEAAAGLDSGSEGERPSTELADSTEDEGVAPAQRDGAKRARGATRPAGSDDEIEFVSHTQNNGGAGVASSSGGAHKARAPGRRRTGSRRTS